MSNHSAQTQNKQLVYNGTKSKFGDYELKIHIERVKSLVDPETLLTMLGFEITTQNQTEIRCACVIHGGDGTTSFRYKRLTNTFSCFSHNCHELNGSDVIGLVRSVLNMGFMEAVEYLSDMVGVSFNPQEVTESDIVKFQTNKLIKEQRSIEKFDNTLNNTIDNVPSISEDLIEKFVSDRGSYFINRGFQKETLDIYEVGTTYKFKEGPRETVTIRDEFGKFVGMSSRLGKDLDSYGAGVPKYRILKEFDKNSFLYGLNIAIQFVEDFDSTLILTEGFTDVWSFWEIGIPIAVSCMGISVSNVQRYLLSKYCNKCIVVFDGDEPGRNGTKRVYNYLKDFIKVIPYYPEEGMEPSKYTRKELQEIFKGIL